MLYILFTVIFLLPVLLGFGSIFMKLSGIYKSNISLRILTGIISITTIFTITAFFFPLNVLVEAPILFIGLAAFFYFKEYKSVWNFFAEHQWEFCVLAFITVFFGSYYPFILDHFGYYVPTVKWISEVGLVKGISNLDLVLGQMSMWHIFQAGFSNFSDPFLRLNTIVLITYLIYIFEKKSWINLIFLPVLYLFTQSPSPDLPVIAFSLMVLNEVWRANTNSVLLFLISIFIFCIKPTLIWVPLFVFLYSLLILKKSVKFVLPGICILLLFFIKNIWVFGYPVFPMQFVDLGCSWKPNAQLLKNSAEMAIQKTYDMQFTYSKIDQFSRWDYIKNWFLLEGIKGKINTLFIISLIVFFVFALKKNSTLVWILLVSVVTKSVLVLLFSAQYRFFIDVFFVIFFVFFVNRFSRKFSMIAFFVMSSVLALFLSYPNLFKNHLPSFRVGSLMGSFKAEQFIRPSTYDWNHYRSYQIGNLDFKVVDGYILSFDIPIPAISPDYLKEYHHAGIFPQLKGKTLKEGFIWKNLTPKEKMQLQEVLENYLLSLHDKK